MKKLAVFLLTGLTCASMLFGCGSKNDTVETVPVAEVQESTAAPAETESETETETVEEDVPPEEGMVKSDLTGEWISGDLADQRPIAVMIPDENAALPHYGLSNADILYECSVEGNMTRLMAVFKDWKNIERIGNIRSCRDYYVYWAKEWDAIYCHIGGPFYILNAINDPTTNNITGAVLASDPSQKKVCMTQPSTAPATVKLRIMLIQAATVSTKPLRRSAIPKPILRTIRAITSNSLPQTIRTRWNSTEAVQSLQPRSIWQALTRLPRPISNITKKMVCTIASRVCRKATRSIWTAPITNSWHSRTF